MKDKYVSFQTMNEAEYEFWSQRSIQQYAEDKSRSGLSAEQALDMAKKSFKTLLPEGHQSRDQFLYKIQNENEETVGWLWYAGQGQIAEMAFLYDIIIEEEFRGQGYGRLAMRLLEQDAKMKGFQSLGLHVFGFNEVAIKLYQSMNFDTVDLVMMKSLTED